MRDQIKAAKCNGITLAANPGNVHTLISDEKINTIRSRIQDDQSFWLDRKERYPGFRYSSNISVRTRIAGALYTANITVSYLDEDEIDYLVTDALRDCSEADYYYQFLKEYE